MGLTAQDGGGAAPPFDSEKALVWSNVITFTGAITFNSDVTILGNFTFGDISTDSLTMNGTLFVSSDNKLEFRAAANYLNSPATGKLYLDAAGTGADDFTIHCTTTMDDNLTIAANKTITLSGSGTITTPTLYAPAIAAAASSNVALTINAAGNETITIGGVSTGTITFGQNVQLSASKTLSLSGSIYMAGGADYTPIRIGTKANTAGSGVVLAGDADDSGGVQIYADDGGVAAVGDVLSPLRCRYLLSVSQSGGKTQTGLFAQLRTLDTLTFTTGGIRGAYVFSQIGSNNGLVTNAEMVGINQATTIATGNMTVGSGCRFAGVDINVAGTGAIVNNGTSAALLIRSSGTPVWPNGIQIENNGALIGIIIGTVTTGLSLTGTMTTGLSITGTCGTAINVTGGIMTLVKTETSATPSSTRAIWGKEVTYSSMTSGTLCGVRGEANMAGNVAGSYLYGAQGKLITNAYELSGGSSHYCGVMAQVDVSGGTLTSGHIACLICSVQDTGNSTALNMDGIYVELPTYGSGSKTNAVIRANGASECIINASACNGAAQVLFDVATTNGCWSATGASGDAGKIAVKLNGTLKYLNVFNG